MCRPDLDPRALQSRSARCCRCRSRVFEHRGASCLVGDSHSIPLHVTEGSKLETGVPTDTKQPSCRRRPGARSDEQRRPRTGSWRVLLTPEAVGKRRSVVVSRWISTTVGGPSHTAPLGHAQMSPLAGPLGAALWSFQHRRGFTRQPRLDASVHRPSGSRPQGTRSTRPPGACAAPASLLHLCGECKSDAGADRASATPAPRCERVGSGDRGRLSSPQRRRAVRWSGRQRSGLAELARRVARPARQAGPGRG
jgi:hypothetical protein